MKSIFMPIYREKPHVPVVHAYYDRADMQHTTRRQSGNHAHSLCEIMYVSEGRVMVDLDQGRVPLGRRQYIWLDAEVAHRLELDGSTPCSMMNIEFQLVERAPDCPTVAALCSADPALEEMMATPTPYLVLTDTDDAVYNLLKQIIQLAESGHPQADGLCGMLTGQVLQLVARGRQQSTRSNGPGGQRAHVEKAIHLIESRLTEPLTAQDIAQALHVQPAYLHRLFKESTGETIGDFAARRRLSIAKERLRDGDEPVAAIAMDCGFSSQQRFAQLFRRSVGMTPSEYRKHIEQTNSKED